MRTGDDERRRGREMTEPRDTVFESPAPYDGARIGAAAIYCSDGRLGDHFDDFLHRGLRLPRYDRLACPGGPACLAGRLAAFWEARGVEDQLRFLVRAHGLRQAVLVGHEGCAYYRERLGLRDDQMEREQLQDLHKAAWALARMNVDLGVQGFFARVAGSRVRFERVAVEGGTPRRASR